MRTLLIAIFAVLASLGGANSQTADVSKTLTELEASWCDALVKGDVSRLNTILADTYVDAEEGGHLSDKKDTLGVLKSGDLKFKSIKLSNMKVHNYGTAAVVTGTAAQEGTFKGQALAPLVIFTDTFVLQNGTWKAAASARAVAPK